MSDLISMRLDNQSVLAALLRAPRTVERHLERKLSQGAIEVADTARNLAPVSHKNLANSIQKHRISWHEYHVVASVNYARSVEKGTKPGYWPNIGSLFEYLKTKFVRTTGFRWKKRGSIGRFTQEAELAGRAIGLMRYIHAHGTKPHPFMAPAAEKMESRVMALIRQGVVDGLHEAGLS